MPVSPVDGAINVPLNVPYSFVVTSTVPEVIYPKTLPKDYNDTVLTTFNWTPATYSGPSVTVRYKVERYLLQVTENLDGTTTTKDISYPVGVTSGLTLNYLGRNLRTAISREKLNTKVENTIVFRVTSYTGDDTSLSGRTDNLVTSVNFVSLLVKPAL